MDISRHIKEFAGKNHRYKPYSKICRKMLLGGMPYSLNSQKGYEESEYLPYNIRSCVQAYRNTMQCNRSRTACSKWRISISMGSV